MSLQLKQQFNEIAQQYDTQRRQLIPYFDALYETAVALADLPTATPVILDIGAGTGLLSSYFLARFPKATIYLIDISENMLDIARQRFQGNPAVHYIVGDYTTYPFEQSFDLIVSALSIHHLEDIQKQALYERCYSLLTPNGCFINADQILEDTEYKQARCRDIWFDYIESGTLSQEEKTGAYNRMKLDKEAPLSLQLDWLRQAGFSEVGCLYRYLLFVILFGRKTTEG